MDTRQWISLGVVDPDTGDQHSTRFKDADDAALAFGVLVNVTLQPSGIPIQCRVGSIVAGIGEAYYVPFQQGDEVLVALPEGDEGFQPVIIARLNNEIDTWPAVVGGQDATQNTFGFLRLRTPFIVETSASYLIRSVTTFAQIGIDQDGQIIMNDADGGRLFMGADAFGLSLPASDNTSIQLLRSGPQIALTVGNVTFFTLDTSASQFTTPGTLAIATSGGFANGHAITAEQVTALICNVLASLAQTGSFTAGPLGPTYAVSPQSALGTVLGPAILALAGVVPVGPLPGGNFAALLPPIFGPTGAISVALANPLAGLDPTGTTPGLGRPGFTL